MKKVLVHRNPNESFLVSLFLAPWLSILYPYVSLFQIPGSLAMGGT